MIRQPEDQDWDRIVERVDLDVSAADLAAAERAMREVEAADVEPVSPAWVEATVAKVKHDAAVAAEPRVVAAPVMKPVLGGGWWDGVKRFAAAVLAFASLHTAATAATVTVTVGAAVVAVLVWSERAHSSKTLPFERAILVLDSESDPPASKESAMRIIGDRVATVIHVLKQTRDSEPGGSDESEAARSGLARLRAVLLGQRPGSVTEALGEVPDLSSIASPRQSQLWTDMAILGVLALQSVNEPSIEEGRMRLLRKLTASAAN